MEQNLKFRLLESICKVYEQSKKCKLDSTYFEKLVNELQHLSDYFKVLSNHSFIGFCNAENLSKNKGIKIGFTKN